MLKTISENWPIIITTSGLLIGIGKILSMVKTICDRLDGHDKSIIDANSELKGIGKMIPTLTTLTMCERCREACERRNSLQFGELKAILSDMADKRDEMIVVMGDVACKLSGLTASVEDLKRWGNGGGR